MAIGSSLANMVGPALSAWLFETVGAPLMLGVNAGTTAVLAATAVFLVLGVERPESATADSWNLFSGVRDGWVAIRSAPCRRGHDAAADPHHDQRLHRSRRGSVLAEAILRNRRTLRFGALLLGRRVDHRRLPGQH